MFFLDNGGSQPPIIRIRDLSVSPPVALAPMVGLSHSALRSLVLEEGGVGLFFSEMLAIKRLPHDTPEQSPLLVRSSAEFPLFYQIVASGDEYIADAVHKLEALGAQGIDLNLGCPAPVLRKQGAGMFLLRNSSMLTTILTRLRNATRLPVSVKIRLGERGSAPELYAFCMYLIDLGVDLITIHARLNGEKFCRRPRWGVIGEIKHRLTVPVLINGGIFSVDDARRCLEESGGDGLMIGRGAAGKPWLCREIASALYGIPAHPRNRSFAEVFNRFIDLLEERFAPERQLGRLKQFSAYFALPLPFGHHFATAMQTSRSIQEAKERAGRFFAREYH